MESTFFYRFIPRIGRNVFQTRRHLTKSSLYAMPDHMVVTAKHTRQNVTAPATVTEIKDLSKNVKFLKLYVEEDKFTFKAGQWIDMFIPGVQTVGGFSICSSPDLLASSRVFHLSVKFSKHPPAYWIHSKCQPGDSVMVRAGGDFFYDPQATNPPSDILLLAGGVGVNPLYSILSHSVSQSANNSTVTKDRKATLLYSAKSFDELLFREELMKIDAANPNVNVKFHCSREESNLVKGISGLIDQSHIEKALSTFDKSNTDIYICGPFSFINDMEYYCNKLVQKDRIHYEKWW